MRKQLLLLSLLVLALRLPFLYQAIQGDDVYYLYGAEHALEDPLHPTHAKYAFTGQIVDMRGHPHPPLNAWYLAGLLALFHSVREIPFHAAYILFSLIAAWSALCLARRFTRYPLAAAVLFVVTPTFVINGNSLESDLPFVAVWLASISLFVTAVDAGSSWRLCAGVIAMALAAMAAYQAIVLTPILLLYLWRKDHEWKPAWAAAFAAPAVIAVWQVFERVTSGALPAAVLTGYMQTYHLQALLQKGLNAAALTGHLGWILFPVLTVAAFKPRQKWVWIVVVAATICAAALDVSPLFWFSITAGVLILLACSMEYREFPAQWVLVFFVSALIIFFAGSARYLLPIALPVAILASQRMAPRWLYLGAGVQLALSLSLATVNYQHWDGYRKFARSLAKDAQTKRVWVNGEWGLRFYLEEEGAEPALANQPVHAGDMVVSSELAYPVNISTTGATLQPIAERVIRSSIPLRLVALGGKSAYSTTLFGLRPFDISTAPIDRVRAEIAVEHKPELTHLQMGTAESASQVVSGIYAIENGQWRWMSGEGALLLKAPAEPEPIEVRYFVPPQSPVRRITVFVAEAQVGSEETEGPGSFTLTTAPIAVAGESVVVTIRSDKTFSVAGDPRELSVILTAAGFIKVPAISRK